ncbi:MAG TPA: class I SAM-dependent methyltransferase [Conexivisphaerales archaeon]|nr:class I SAM-dependent methyltransferase [Conexivisphaerales archaeon]
MTPSAAVEPPIPFRRRGAKDRAAVMRGYDTLMSRVYDFLTCWFMAPLIRESHVTLLEHLKVVASSRLLDVGCGTGTLMALAGASGSLDLMAGADISTAMLERARRKLSRAGLSDRTELVLADAEALPFRESSFGSCACSGTLRFVPDPATALGEACRVLGDGGGLGLREMICGEAPLAIKHIPLPFKPSFVVWRLLPDRWVEAYLRLAGFDGVTSFRKGMVPQFIFAMGPPVRKYAFFFARKPLQRARLPAAERPVAPAIARIERSTRNVSWEA